VAGTLSATARPSLFRNFGFIGSGSRTGAGRGISYGAPLSMGAAIADMAVYLGSMRN